MDLWTLTPLIYVAIFLLVPHIINLVNKTKMKKYEIILKSISSNKIINAHQFSYDTDSETFDFVLENESLVYCVARSEVVSIEVIQ